MAIRTVVLAGGVVLALALTIALVLIQPASAPDASEDLAAKSCDLVDDGRLKPINQVRFTPSHPERQSRMFGVGITDRLSEACNTLLDAGFTVRDQDNARVRINDIGETEAVFATYTNVVMLDGSAINPLDGLPSEVAVTLVASSPATYGSVEYFSVSFTHAEPIPLEQWSAALDDYFGAATPSEAGYSPYWIVSGNALDDEASQEECDPRLFNSRARFFDALPPIDVRADFEGSIPAHDGQKCTIFVGAEPVGGDQAGVDRTMIFFADLQSISANRRAENAHVRRLLYPVD
ncbi:hypothetical protein [Cognatiyoonia sp. IB215182]|uniref:hypothetical protein n=1 Tax=Cognatiyoonia sp. IB215182 TaxID=3097353 RepID=UPI002A17788A|nr:hypothetical protein [Cognatiyoonia sp. IB215182]MDX8352930.1 hypothetical protein [Cognatiyoonia sp. IB215182]